MKKNLCQIKSLFFKASFFNSPFIFPVKKFSPQNNIKKNKSNKLSEETLNKLNEARFFQDLFDSYEINENLIDEKNIIYYIKSISKIFNISEYVDHSLKSNETLKKILKFIHSNIRLLNNYAVIESLILIRYLISNKYENLDNILSLLNEQISQYINDDQLNFKQASQVFQEYVILSINTNTIFQYLKKLSIIKEQQSYITPYCISMILKSFTKNRYSNQKKIYADFGYQLLYFLEPNLKVTELSILCILFRNICLLRINENSSHKRLHPCVNKLKDLIYEKKSELQEIGLLQLVQGFAHFPRSLDNKFQLYLKSSTLYTIDKAPHNLSTKFLYKYVEGMSEQYPELKLDNVSLNMIGNEICKRLKSETDINLSLICNIIKAFSKNNYCHKELFHFLYMNILNKKKEIIKLTLGIIIAKFFLDVKFDCKEYLILISDQFKKEFNEKPIDLKIKILDLYSNPIYINESNFFKICDELVESIKNDLKLDKYDLQMSFLIFLGENFYYITNPHFQELHNTAYELVLKIWDKLDYNKKFQIMLLYINSKNLIEKWQEFFISKLKNLLEVEMKKLLELYIFQENKTFYSFNLILIALLNCSMEIKTNLIRQIIEVIQVTPPHLAINQKGTTNINLRQLINELPKDGSLEDYNLKSVEIVKFGVNLRALNIDSDFNIKLVINQWKKNKDFLLNIKNNYLLAELGESISYNIPHIINKLDLELNKEIFKILNEILKKLNEILDEDKIENEKISLSWLTKKLKIYNCLYKYTFNEIDQFYWKIIIEEIKLKINERTVNSKGSVLKALFTIIELEFLNNINYENDFKIYIYDNLEKSLNDHYITILIKYLNDLDVHIKSFEDRRKFKFYLPVIENFFINNYGVQKFPYIIRNYLKFFLKFGMKNVKIINKMFEQIGNCFNSLKPKDIIEILSSISSIRLQHEEIYQEFSKKIIEQIYFYEKEIPDILNYYAKVGFTNEWAYEFGLKIWKHFKEKIIIDKEKILNRPFHLAFSLLTYNIYKMDNVNDIFKFIQNCIENEYDFKNLEINTYIYLISNFIKENNEINFKFSEKFNKILIENKIWSVLEYNKIENFDEILKKSNCNHIYNYILDNTHLIDIYFPEQKILILYCNSLYVNFDQVTPSGFDILRQKSLEKFYSEYKIIKFNECFFNSKKTPEQRNIFLKEIGLEFLLNNCL